MFLPKTVQSKDDWLASVKEAGQPFKKYKQGGPNIAWSNKRCNTVVLYFLDDSIEQEMRDSLQLYAQAFFHGCQIAVWLPGQKKAKRALPADFFEVHKVARRINPHSGE